MSLFQVKMGVWLFLVVSLAYGQSRVVKASYELSGLSDFLMEGLKSQVSDYKQRDALINKIENSKLYYSLYYDMKGRESLFVMDSMKLEPKVQLGAYNFYTYRDGDGKIEGKDFFMGKEVYFEGKGNDLKWIPLNEIKEISGKSCTKFSLEGYPEVYAWVSSANPNIMAGPYLYLGLPGDVLKTNEPFMALELREVSQVSNKAFKDKKESFRAEKKGATLVTIKDFLKRKKGMFQMVKKHPSKK